MRSPRAFPAPCAAARSRPRWPSTGPRAGAGCPSPRASGTAAPPCRNGWTRRSSAFSSCPPSDQRRGQHQPLAQTWNTHRTAPQKACSARGRQNPDGDDLVVQVAAERSACISVLACRPPRHGALAAQRRSISLSAISQDLLPRRIVLRALVSKHCRQRAPRSPWGPTIEAWAAMRGRIFKHKASVSLRAHTTTSYNTPSRRQPTDHGRG